MTNTQIQNQKYSNGGAGKRLSGKSFGKKSIFSWYSLNCFLACLLVFSGVFYVLVINDIAIKGIVLAELKKEKKELNRTAENHELAIMRLESFDNISNKAERMKMVKVDKIDYIVLNNNGVAMK